MCKNELNDLGTKLANNVSNEKLFLHKNKMKN